MAAVKIEENVILELLGNLIREENRGQRYFKEAGQISREPDVKKLFEKLAEDERNHLEVLTRMRASIVDGSRMTHRQKSIMVDGKAVNVLDLSDMAMDTTDLPQLDLFKNDEFADLFSSISIKSVLEYAMKIEYDNARYIKEFLQYIHSKKFRDILLQLIQEEKEHFIALQKIQRKL